MVDTYAARFSPRSKILCATSMGMKGERSVNCRFAIGNQLDLMMKYCTCRTAEEIMVPSRRGSMIGSRHGRFRRSSNTRSSWTPAILHSLQGKKTILSPRRESRHIRLILHASKNCFHCHGSRRSQVENFFFSRSQEFFFFQVFLPVSWRWRRHSCMKSIHSIVRFQWFVLNPSASAAPCSAR